MTIHDLRASTPVDVPARVDAAKVVQRISTFRRSFSEFAVSFPADLVCTAAAEDWLLRHRVGITARDRISLNSAVAAGLSTDRMAMNLGDEYVMAQAALAAGVRRFAISSDDHVAVLAARSGPRSVVVVEHTAELRVLMHALAAHRRLEVVGFQVRAGECGDPLGVQAIRSAVRDMACLRRAHRVLLTRICLDGLDLPSWCDNPRVLGHIRDALDEAVGSACEHHRFPRPVLSITPTASSLLNR